MLAVNEAIKFSLSRPIWLRGLVLTLPNSVSLAGGVLLGTLDGQVGYAVMVLCHNADVLLHPDLAAKRGAAHSAAWPQVRGISSQNTHRFAHLASVQTTINTTFSVPPASPSAPYTTMLPLDRQGAVDQISIRNIAGPMALCRAALDGHSRGKCLLVQCTHLTCSGVDTCIEP